MKKHYLLLLLLSFITIPGWAQTTILGFSPTGLTTYGPSPWDATSKNGNVTVGGLTRGAGVTTPNTAVTDAWGGVSWQGGANQDATFTVTANAGYRVSLSTFNLTYRKGSVGPSTGLLQYSLNSGVYNTISSSLSFSSTATAGAAIPAVDLTTITDLQNVPAGTVITFRIAPTGATNITSSGAWYVYSTGLTVSGTVTPTLPELILGSSSPAITPSYITQNSTKNPIYNFQAPVTGGNVSVESITFTTSGT